MSTRTCKICGEERPIEAFGKTISEGNGRKYHRHECRKCTYQRQAAWREKNRDRLRELNRKNVDKSRKSRMAADPIGFRAQEAQKAKEYRAQLKAKVYEAYGGFKCACCGESEPLFLSIDHVNNNGYQLRKNGQGGGAVLYLWLWREFKKTGSWPTEYQILCMNCQHGKARNGGVCPHCK